LLFVVAGTGSLFLGSQYFKNKSFICEESQNPDTSLTHFVDSNGTEWARIDSKPIYTKLASTMDVVRYYLFKFLSLASAGLTGFAAYKLFNFHDIYNILGTILGGIGTIVFWTTSGTIDSRVLKKRATDRRMKVLKESTLLSSLKKFGIDNILQVTTPLELRQKFNDEFNQVLHDLFRDGLVSRYEPFFC